MLAPLLLHQRSFPLPQALKRGPGRRPDFLRQRLIHRPMPVLSDCQSANGGKRIVERESLKWTSLSLQERF